jgi:RimJ/RimL family protein N-acetyltransferase
MMLELKPVKFDDIPQLAAIARRIWWDHYPPIIGEEQVRYMLELNYSKESLEQQMADGQFFWWILADYKPVGLISAGIQSAGCYFIHKFYIDPEFQGRGVGLEAFKLLLAQYPDAREVRLTVNRQNYKSINFYFKIGFIIEKCLDIPIGEGFVMNDFQMLYRRP